MFSCNIKGKENPKDPQLVKLEMIFFKTGYARVPKVLSITGPFKDWDNETQSFTSKSSEAIEKNKRLLDLKTKYLKVAEDWEAENKPWAPVQWSHHFDVQVQRTQEVKVISVAKTLDLVIEQISQRQRIKHGKVLSSVGTARNYKDLRTTLTEFTLQKYERAFSTYYFDEITSGFVNDYVFFIQKRAAERGNEGNLYGRLRKFYGLLYYAQKMHIPNVDLTVFEQSRPKAKPKPFVPKTLPADVITKIEHIDRSIFSRLELFHIDLFLFSFYTGGMANIDVAYLTKDCIDQDGRLNYERIKFPKTARMKFNAKAQAIVDRYKEKCYGDYLLPVFSHKHKTEAQQRGRLKRLCDKVNKTLKKVKALIKYKGPLTWYSARGTFISMMIDNNIHPIVVAQMAGNSPNTIYKHYFKNTKEEVIDREVEKAYGC